MFERSNTIGPADNQDEKQSLFRRQKVQETASDPASVTSQFYVQQIGNVRKYWDDYRMSKKEHLAFTAKANSIQTSRDDRQTIGAMLAIAQARGWDRVYITGSKDFVAEAWVEAKVRGIEVEGYKPTQPQRQEADKRLARMSVPNASTAETKAKQPTTPQRKTAAQRQETIFGNVERLGKAKRAGQAPEQVAKQTAAP